MCSGLFLYSISQAAYKGYEFRQQELEYSQYEELNHKLKVKALEAKSYEELQKAEKVQEMVKPENVEFADSRLKRLTKAINDPV